VSKYRIGTTKDYQDFISSLAWEIKRVAPGQHWPKSQPIEVKILLATRKDIDGLIKPILDSIERSGLIEDDDQVALLVVSRTRITRLPDLISLRIAPHRGVTYAHTDSHQAGGEAGQE